MHWLSFLLGMLAAYVSVFAALMIGAALSDRSAPSADHLLRDSARANWYEW